MNALALITTTFLITLFTSLTSPLSLGITVIVTSLMVSISMSTILSNSWFSFLLLMVFISGLMVIFVYVSSLAANKVSSIRILPLTLCPIMTAPALTLYPNNLMHSTIDASLPNSVINMYKIYSTNIFILTIFMIVYLLVTLITVVKNSYTSAKPIRSKNSHMIMMNTV